MFKSKNNNIGKADANEKKIIKNYYQRPDDCCDYGVSCIRPDTGTCSMGNV